MIDGRGLRKSFGGSGRDGKVVPVLRGVDFSIKEGEFYVLLGPSGSGKTTTLRAVAGLERPDSGVIEIRGQTVFSAAEHVDVAPEERPIAMVFQSYALWPHMNVYDNIAFPIRRGIRRPPKQEVKGRVERVLSLLHLEQNAHRPISTLSGGQQQRVALARALALEPAVLLMDEPLSNLDAKLRAQLRVELKELTTSVGITTLYVTHDQVEAMVMGDRVAVMNEGEILQEGAPSELYERPKDLFVARFIGEMNFIHGTVESMSGEVARVRTGFGVMTAACGSNAPRQGAALVGFRPEDGAILTQPGANSIGARITGRQYMGDVLLYEAQIGSDRAMLRRPKSDEYGLGQDVFVDLPPSSCLVFEGEESALAGK